VSAAPHRTSFAADFRRNFLAGLFILIPIGVTVWIVYHVFAAVSRLGSPMVEAMLRGMTLAPGRVAELRPVLEWLKDGVAFVLVILGIYLLGWATNLVLGRRLLALFDDVVGRIPLVKNIYVVLKQLVGTFQTKPEGVDRVVLVNFPHDRMKTIGLVMRTFTDSDTGRELAAVYVPTAPYFTSGQLRLIPVDEVINTTWSVDEAMRFIVSGGSVTPETINYERTANRPAVMVNHDDATTRRAEEAQASAP